jgi:hypothetical protein
VKVIVDDRSLLADGFHSRTERLFNLRFSKRSGENRQVETIVSV